MTASSVTPQPARLNRCMLPGGFVDAKGDVHREVEFWAMTGHDEELLTESPDPLGAAQITALLTRKIRRIGAIAPVSEEVARDLLVVDRQYLVLKVREATFGTSVHSTIPCPWPDCGRLIHVDFDTGSIPVVESTDKGPIYTMRLEPAEVILEGPTCHDVGFRLPTGADQEALCPLLDCGNEAKALTGLLQRCVVQLGELVPPPPELVAQLTPRARLAIEAHMSRVMPQLDLTMESTCPECDRNYSVPFELQRLLLGELTINTDLLYREVHYLAYHYHWSEREIMEMPRATRRRYVQLLADEIERARASA